MKFSESVLLAEQHSIHFQQCLNGYSATSYSGYFQGVMLPSSNGLWTVFLENYERIEGLSQDEAGDAIMDYMLGDGLF